MLRLEPSARKIADEMKVHAQPGQDRKSSDIRTRPFSLNRTAWTLQFAALNELRAVTQQKAYRESPTPVGRISERGLPECIYVPLARWLLERACCRKTRRS